MKSRICYLRYSYNYICLWTNIVTHKCKNTHHEHLLLSLIADVLRESQEFSAYTIVIIFLQDRGVCCAYSKICKYIWKTKQKHDVYIFRQLETSSKCYIKKKPGTEGYQLVSLQVPPKDWIFHVSNLVLLWLQRQMHSADKC